LFIPADADDLATFLKGCPADVPLLVIGVGSNLLVRDGGVEGVVIRLGRGFMNVTRDGAHRLRAGAAVLDVAVAKAALEAELAGLEFMRGIPGGVGGGLRMNAGAYGREFKDTLVEAVALTRMGARVVLSNAEMGFSYRKSDVKADLIFIEGLFEGTPGDKAEIEARMKAIAGAGVSGHLVQVLDPAEETLPYEGRAEFLGVEDGSYWIADRAESLRERYQAKLAAHREALTQAARRLGWTMLVHHTDRSAAEPILSLVMRLQGQAGDYRLASASTGETAAPASEPTGKTAP
jgi:hypothetical protein